MKRILLCLLLFLPIMTQAQSLSFEQLLFIKKAKGVESINDLLQSRGWQFDEAEPGDDFDQVVWVWLPNEDSEPACIINVIVCKGSSCEGCEDEPVRTVIYRFLDSSVMERVKRRAQALGMNSSTQLYTATLSTIYTGARYRLRLDSYTPGGRMALPYSVTLNSRSVD